MGCCQTHILFVYDPIDEANTNYNNILSHIQLTSAGACE